MVRLSVDNGVNDSPFNQPKSNNFKQPDSGFQSAVDKMKKQPNKPKTFNQVIGGVKDSKKKDSKKSSGKKPGGIVGRLNMSGQGFGVPAPQEPSDLEKLIAELQSQTQEGFTWEDQAREQQMIDQIFGSQLSQIASARDQTNSRFQESTANTKNLYGGHVNEIRGKDRAIYEDIAGDAKTNTNQTFDQGIGTMQAAQNSNRAESEEMMSRLGLQASAPVAVESANEQQNSIDALAAAKVSAQTQNDAYGAADLRRNDARAQSIADESVSKQADLSRQLQDILGDLGSKEADVNSAKSEAMYGAYQNAQSNWRGDREYATSALAQLMEAQGSAQDSASSMNAPAMSNVLASLGINNPSLQEDYTSAYTDAVLNAKYYPGQQDQTSVYLNYLRRENPDLDPNLLYGLVQGNLGYGTYKPGTPMS